MTLIYFILILGVTILIHELGHFIFAKRSGIYVYEFAIGMGPRIFAIKRKNDETTYSIRLIPLGGFVQLAGETVEEDKDIPKEMRLQSKSWLARFITIVAGATFNFLLAIFILFMIGLFYGAPSSRPIVDGLEKGYPAYNSGITKGDIIINVNNKEVRTWDDILIQLELSDKNVPMKIKVQHPNKTYTTYYVKLKKEQDNNMEIYRLGIDISDQKTYGLIAAIKYAGSKTVSLFKTMFIVISSLFSGALGLNKVAGPIGIYSIVGNQAASGFDSILYLIAFLSINVGFINLIPFPAFDGGRILFLVIERLKGSPVDPKVENYFHTVGFFILMALMLYITFNDLVKLF